MCRAYYACWLGEGWCWKCSFLILFGQFFFFCVSWTCSSWFCGDTDITLLLELRLPNCNTLWHLYSYKDVDKRKEWIATAGSDPHDKQEGAETKLLLLRVPLMLQSPFVDKWSKLMPYGVSWFLLKEFVNNWCGDKMIFAVVVCY